MNFIKNLNMGFINFEKQFKLRRIEISNLKKNNRIYIKSVSENKAGIYIWLTPLNKIYIGRSINLYARIRSYYHSTPKQKGISLIRRYLKKYGFDNMRLILFIVSKKHVHILNDLVNIEQSFLDYFKPDLNLTKIATPTINDPKYRFTYATFVKQRSHSIAVLDMTSKQLLWVFDSKHSCIKSMQLHHSTLNKCIAFKKHYLSHFYFQLNSNFAKKPAFKNLKVFLDLVKLKRKQCTKSRNKKVQKIYAQNILNPAFNCTFDSQRDCAKYFKADRETVRKYIKDPNSGYYKKAWKLTVMNKIQK